MNLGHLLAELKRRKVFRVAAVYGVVAFVIAQAADIAFPALHLPPWTVTLVVALALLGFPIALVLAWAFEVTPDGVVRTEGVARTEGGARAEGAAAAEGEPEDAPRRRSAAVAWGVGGLAVVVALLLAFGKLPFAPEMAEGVDPVDAAGTAGAPAAAGTPGTAGAARPVVDRSIAVLPFANLSPDPENEYFSDGITEEILATLAGIGELRVTSRTSVMQYKDTRLPLAQIADELGVASILEGSVRRAGDQVRITAQLIDARTDEHLWAETFERQLTVENLFAVQSEIAREIARVLEARLSPAERGRLEHRPTDDLAAYELYLRSLGFRRGDGATPDEAKTYLRAALELDPEFALAEATLADVFFFRHLLSARGEYLDSARAHMYRALELDPELPDALLMRAQDLYGTGNPASALPVLRRALELSPSHPGVLLALAEVQLELGGYAEALEFARRGAEIERTLGIFQAMEGAVLARVGAFDEARGRFLESLEGMGMPPPLRGRFIQAELAASRRAEAETQLEEIRGMAYRADLPRAWELLADLELDLGMTDAAREHYERQQARLPPDHQDIFTGLALIYREDGRTGEAEALLAEAEETARRWLAEGGRTRGDAHFTLARVHAIRGDPDRAVQALEAAVAAGWDDYYATRLDPRLADLEGHPRYEAVMDGVRARLERARVRLLGRDE